MSENEVETLEEALGVLTEKGLIEAFIVCEKCQNVIEVSKRAYEVRLGKVGKNAAFVPTEIVYFHETCLKL